MRSQSQSSIHLQSSLNVLRKSQDQQTIVVHRPVDEVYAFWRNFANLPKFMGDISEVQVLSPSRSKWSVDLASGFQMEWFVEITEDEPFETLIWETHGESIVHQLGAVTFKSLGSRDTQVTLSLQYQIPPEFIELRHKLLGDGFGNLAFKILHQFKACMEEEKFL